GSARVLMPEATHKAFGKIISEGYFAPSNFSGSFAKNALAEWTAQASWSDCVLLAGDLGRNSETSMLVESFCDKYDGLLSISQDAVECIYGFADKLFKRKNTTLVLSFAQMQKLAALIGSVRPFLHSSNLVQVIEAAEEFSKNSEACTVFRFHDNLIISLKGEVVSTPAPENKIWRVEAAAKTSVWWLQNPQKQLETIVTSLMEKTDV
ncbi:MAG: hypothetical protein M3Q70_02540, partial [bacterium]|nr:hypothetical protein [bacterium]